MNPKEFYDLTKRMREKQREYFRTRRIGVLEDCRKLEKEIDAEISRVEGILLRQRQGKELTLPL